MTATMIAPFLKPEHLTVRDPQLTAEDFAGENWITADGFEPRDGYPGFEVSTLSRYRIPEHTDADGNHVPAVYLRQQYAGRSPIYPRVTLRDAKGQPGEYYSHVVAYRSFHGAIPERYEIDHYNGNSFDNRLSNLRMTTRAGNERAAVRRRRHLGITPTPWLKVHDLMHGPYGDTTGKACQRGHTFEQFGTRRDGSCSACRSLSNGTAYKVHRASMEPWIDAWRADMTRKAVSDRTPVAA